MDEVVHSMRRNAISPQELYIHTYIHMCKHKYVTIYHFDTSHQRKPQGYIISNIPWKQVYIMIYPVAMVTSHGCRNKTTILYIGARMRYQLWVLVF